MVASAAHGGEGEGIYAYIIFNAIKSRASKIAEGETEGLGDTSTLADPLVVDILISGRPTGALDRTPTNAGERSKS